jgi:autonomous glycyl radical cofactor GrcA
MALARITKFEQVPVAVAKRAAKEASSVRTAVPVAVKPEVRVAGGQK